MTWISISLSLWLILVGARRANSSYKEAVVSDFNPPHKRYLFSALNKYCGLASDLFCWPYDQLCTWFQRATQTRGIKKIRSCLYIYIYERVIFLSIMDAVSLFSAAGVGDGSASSGDLRVSLFSWISAKNLSRQGRSIKEKVMLAVNWRLRPSFPSLNMYTDMQNFP